MVQEHGKGRSGETCESLHQEQHRATLHTLDEMSHPIEPSRNTPSTSQLRQVLNSVQADPAKTRSSSDRDTNNSSFV